MLYGRNPSQGERYRTILDEIRTLFSRVFAMHNVITLDRNAGSFDDPRFMGAFSVEARDDQERRLV